ncbi:MAG: exodeoxyribonuclease VII small subunit [Crocinitomicaceae bacterium]|nr:exodeoxyribonuclease VII small subunit [Crocinitomicaceae bacterium]
MNNDLTYESAFAELQQIAVDLESEAVPVDILAEKIKHASFLVEFCQKKLRSAETEVTKILKKWDDKSEE